MADFVYPTTAELKEISREKMPNLMADRPIFKVLPVTESNHHLLVWEQKDNIIGLQQVRGLGGSPARVNKTGASRFQVEPGVYGEFVPLEESELTRRRTLGTWNGPVDISDLVMAAQEQLLTRRLDRIESIGWTLLTSGTFSVTGPAGTVLHSDSYTFQTSTPGTTWATVATAAPLANLRTVRLLGPARGANFGRGAVAYMNGATWNDLVGNTNANDLGGRFTVLKDTERSLETVNSVTSREDLPTFAVYDDGYFNDAGTFTRFIPNNKVVVVGTRKSGETIGEYRMTMNLNSNTPGAYTRVIDRIETNIPRSIEVHDGHNGGPVVYFPGSVCIMTV